MNKLLFIILTTFIAPAVSADSPLVSKSALVNFVNGDSVSGKIVSLQDGMLKIDSPYFLKEASFQTKDILNITLPQAAPETHKKHQKKDHLATLEIEDRFGYDGEYGNLFGQLESLSETAVTLNTTYAGSVQVDRSLIKSISITDHSEKLYTGPKSIEEWNTLGAPETWIFANNALISNPKRGTIAQDLKIPNKAILKFNLSWKVKPSLSLYIYANTSEAERPPASYELRLSSNHMYMLKATPNNHSKKLIKTPSSQLTLDEKLADISIYMDKDKGIFHVFINGKKKYTFTDHNPSPDILGSSILFKNNHGTRMLIKDIQVQNWTDSLPTEEDQKAYAKLTGNGQKILLVNGDAVVGKVGPISNGLLAVDTQYAPLKIPLSTIRHLHLPPLEENHPKAERNDIKAYYHSGGWVIIDVSEINNEHILGENKAIGRHKFDLKAFKKIEFNIYDQSQNKLRLKDSW